METKKPRLARKIAVIGLGAAALTSLVSLLAWFELPADALIPIHWGLCGEPDRFAGRQALFYLPLMVLGVAAVLVVVPLIEPRKLNLERSAKAYVMIAAAVMAILVGVHIVSIYGALGGEANMAGVLSILMGALFAIIGNYLGKVRSNFFVGVRTPWTLSSELSWNKTHRVAGRLFVAAGVLMILLALLAPPELAMGVPMAVLGIGVVGVVVYSYIVWKADPDKAGHARDG